MDEQAVQRLRAEVVARKNLPTIPTVLAKILQLVDSESSSGRDLIAVIEHDQALTGKMLRLANSAFFGQSRKVATIPRAVVLLGFSTVRNLALGVKVWDALGTGIARNRLEELWAHTVAVAVATKALAASLRAGDPDEAFTAGLLHDVGKLMIGAALETEPEPADGAELLVEDAEIRAVGMSHTEAGAILLEHWGLPYWLVAAVGSHHAPQENSFLVADLLHLADTLCLSAGLGTGRDGLRYRVSPEVSLRWNLSRRSVERIVERTVDALGEAGALSTAGRRS